MAAEQVHLGGGAPGWSLEGRQGQGASSSRLGRRFHRSLPGWEGGLRLLTGSGLVIYKEERNVHCLL